MKLAFHMGYASLSDKNYGSEIALLNLAKQFQIYYDVTIYSSNCMTEQFIEGVRYTRPGAVITDDILIISRYMCVFVDHTIKSQKVYIWVHDTTFQPFYSGQVMRDNGAHLFANMENRIDGVIVLTEFHKQLTRRNYSIPENKIHVIGNAILTDKFLAQNITKDRYKFIYTSCPKRGLDILLKLFPVIHGEFPDAQLYIYRGDESFTEGQREEMKKYPYIHYMGAKSNDVVIQEFLSAGVWLYPTNFVETYCISALEAQMAGCMCITSQIGSLPEIIGNRGVVVMSEYNSTQYIEDVLRSVRIFLKTDLYDNKVASGRKWAIEQSWENAGRKWLTAMKENPLPCSAYIINLARQSEKWKECTKHLDKFVVKYERFDATDGCELEWGEELQKYFILHEDSGRYIPHRGNAGIFGCAMSHIRLWEKISEKPLEQISLVMEDDILLNEDFSEKWKDIYNYVKDDKSWDILYLGFIFFGESILDTDIKVRDGLYKLVKSDKRQRCGGTHCYAIRSSGAKKILEVIKNSKIHRAIDWFLIDNYDKINAYLAYPLICEQNRNMTSTVQGNQKTLRNLKAEYCTVEYRGGLGNQLFQIFTLLAYSIKTGKIPIFQYRDKSICGNRNTHWNSVFSAIRHKCVDKLDINMTRISETQFNTYFDIPSINGNVCLDGYFQSPKFFEEHKESIYTMLGFDKMINNIKVKYSELLDGNNLVSVHFRMGDYKTNAFHPIQTVEYYRDALNQIIKPNIKYKILYFCEAEDNDTVLDYISNFECRDMFVKVLDTISDIDQLFIMSQCDMTVISNSSFSWWGAYLGKPKQIVKYPTIWTRDHTVNDDMIPEQWRSSSASKYQ
jgi:GR25 family glycosyltransferase involved in LPS biosynthesis/glycosyltransferase involved in cell wall biosynthesis